jgi:hypothetical protein
VARGWARRGARGLARDESGIAMMSAIMLTFIMGALSLLVLALVASQVTPTQFARKSTRTVYAAETGMNAALAQIRAAAAAPDFTDTVYGDRSKLPCTVNGPVDLTGSDLTYAVTVQYFKESPDGKSATWRNANDLTCIPGSGLSVQPTHAIVTSQGLADGVPGMATSVGDRTLTLTYQFQVSNTNVPGGLIYTFNSGHCLQATGTTAGSTVTYVDKSLCGTDDVHQLWLYDENYTIRLASSTLAGDQLCITGPSTDDPTDAVDALLKVCESNTSTARWNQLWSWEGGARWKGENKAITTYSGVCLFSGVTTGSPGGRTLRAGKSCADKQDWGSFNPDPRVGAGAASVATHQIVNYLEFGRCFDVTEQRTDYAYMIAYPCKQDPSPGSNQIAWNHKWFYSEPPSGVASAGPQLIYVYNGTSQKFCLRTPAEGANPAYVTLTSSCNLTAWDQKWTRYNDTGSYESSYRFVDSLGRCISLGDKFDAWSKLIVAPCNESPEQKWNAPPNNANAAVDDVRELP